MLLTGNPFIDALLVLLFIGLAIALIWYVVDYIPIPDPFGRLMKLVAMVIGLIALFVICFRLLVGELRADELYTVSYLGYGVRAMVFCSGLIS